MLQALLSSQAGLATLHVIILIRALTFPFASRRRTFYTQRTRVRHLPDPLTLWSTKKSKTKLGQDLLPDQLQGEFEA